MLTLASWNVNSLTVRLEQVLAWLASTGVDILCLQETKVVDEQFPVAAFESQGFHVAFSGQKAYNGVAMISRHPLSEVTMGIPGWDDPQRRVLAATVDGIRLINLYVPNGAAVGTDKYAYKLAWLDKVTDYIQHELSTHQRLSVVGDFNIAPEDRDVHAPEEWLGCVLVSPDERAAFSRLLALGLTDSFRDFSQDEQAFSWWDYRAGGFQRNRGVRIDHILLSEALRKRCVSSDIDVAPRRAVRPSDHAPVRVTLTE